MTDRITKVVVNTDNYRRNLDVIRSLIPATTKIMTVLKANAYGHGIVALANTANEWGADYMGVASLGEARQIRKAGISSPCLILSYLDIDSIPDAIAAKVSVTAMDDDFISALQQQAEKTGDIVNVHLKIDTGMHRAGCDPQDALHLAKQIRESSQLHLEGVFTHFAESPNPQQDFTNTQLNRFAQCISELQAAGIAPPLIHCANSAAIVAHPNSHFTMVRPGLLSYGLNPLPPEHPKYDFIKTHFTPALSVVSKVAFIRHLEPAESVGYDRRWTARRPSVVALVPIGFGDGYRRTPYSADYILVSGHKAPVVGAISMDQTTIDITDIADVNVGDEVVVLGSQKDASITADDIAASYQTVNYEVVTALSDRLERQYLP